MGGLGKLENCWEDWKAGEKQTEKTGRLGNWKAGTSGWEKLADLTGDI